MKSCDEFLIEQGLDPYKYTRGKFWRSFSDKVPICLDDVIYGCMGLTNNKKTRRETIKEYLKDMTEGVDYMILNNAEYTEFLEHPYLPGGKFIESKVDTTDLYPECAVGTSVRRITFTIVTPDALKTIMMLLNTSEGKQFRLHFIEVEKAFYLYRDYTNNFINEERLHVIEHQKLLQELRDAEHALELKKVQDERDAAIERALKFKEHVVTRELMVEDEYLYIGATEQYAKMGISKIGITKDPKSRRGAYNTGKISSDFMHYRKLYKCHNASLLELNIKNFLKIYRPDPKTEMYALNYDELVTIVDEFVVSHAEHVERMNRRIREYKEHKPACAEPFNFVEEEVTNVKKPEACTAVAKIYPNAFNEIARKIDMRAEDIDALLTQVLNTINETRCLWDKIRDRIIENLSARQMDDKYKRKLGSWEAACKYIIKKQGKIFTKNKAT